MVVTMLFSIIGTLSIFCFKSILVNLNLSLILVIITVLHEVLCRSSVRRQFYSVSMTATANININLNNIKNLRDLSSVVGNARPTKILRTGCVSKASDEDVSILINLNAIS
jgi:hypothetical protein